jgi:peptidoglycan/LPS O-acetylase OafA/YrhL
LYARDIKRAVQRNCDIPALTGLRAIAALWVFLFHAPGAFPRDYASLFPIGRAGFLGVDIFFVLSGFVLALNYAGEGRHRSVAAWGDFLWKRLARVYPVHLAALALFAVGAAVFGAWFAPDDRLTLAGFLRTLTLTHGWDAPILKTWNVVSWSVSCEWAAYIAFPVIAAIAWRVPGRLLCAVLVVLLFIALHLCVKSNVFGKSGIDYGLPRIAAEFSAGVLLCRLYTLEAGRKPWLLVGAIATAGMLLVSSKLAMRFGPHATLEIMPVCAAVIVYGLARSAGPFERLLGSSAFQYLGRISYAFYMVHAMALSVVAAALNGRAGVAVKVAAALILAGVVAHLLHTFVENPARAWMLSRWARARVPTTSAVSAVR